jgi:hypothetical protein
MPNFLARINVRWILMLLAAAATAAGLGFLMGLWLGS